MFQRLMCLLAFCAAVSFAGFAQAAPKEVKIGNQKKGSVDDDNLQQKAPEVIVSAKALEKLWQDWKIEGKPPAIDFTKEFILITTSKGSIINLSAVLDEQGNLQQVGFGTQDFLPGFRFVLGSVSREGVKTVSGKPLPKE